MRKIILKALLGLILITFASSISVKADGDGNAREIGVECVGNYSSWSDLDNLESPYKIGNDFADAFQNDKKNWTVKFRYMDSLVEEKDFRGASLGGNDNQIADNVDLLIYSGHGLTPGSHGAKDYSFALNTKYDTKYAKQSEMYLGNRDLEWLVTFTCNFLASKNMKKIGHMAKGIHAICGFETGVVLTPHMGSVFASKLKKGYSVKESFFATANETRVWYSGGTAGVFTTTKNANDCLTGYGKVASDPEDYSKNSSGYILYSYNY